MLISVFYNTYHRQKGRGFLWRCIPHPPRTTILERLSQGLKRVFRKLHTQLQAAVHAFRGVPQGRAAGAWDAHAALMDRSRDRYG